MPDLCPGAVPVESTTVSLATARFDKRVTLEQMIRCGCKLAAVHCYYRNMEAFERFARCASTRRD
ncbi:hypothetical protein B0H67DRAFT_209047 [Lasiosphaeris hirsuta]|uniref:Uncharacterized protein n=1 Tax=Lasiosphaeris hirsuta TaxID=260670 RepID=A0AA40AS50_9PEZI|nr:hypothetical protein B0H67DRAFT_209047 [Lasiosphaeris hirsuta]